MGITLSPSLVAGGAFLARRRRGLSPRITVPAPVVGAPVLFVAVPLTVVAVVGTPYH